MALVQHWKHLTIFGDPSGKSVVQCSNPPGTHAITGGGWLGGDSSSTDTTGADAAGAPAILTQYPVPDSTTGSTFWYVVFSLTPGASARAHFFATVDDGS